MKKIGRIILFQLLSITLIQAQSINENSIERIGSVKDKITLDQHENFYLLKFKDLSPANKGMERTLKIKSKDDLRNFQNVLLDGFDKKVDNPVNFDMEEYEFRFYYKDRSIRKDYVEIIMEDKKTEETSTLPWLTETSLKKLFSIND